METIFSPADLQTLLTSLRQWFETQVLVIDNLMQVLILVALLLTARLAATPLRKRHRSWTEQRGKPLIPGTLRNAINVLTLPAIWLVLTWLCVFIAIAFDWQSRILNIAGSLMAAWIVIRFTATLFRNPFLTRTIAGTAWTVAALHILGILQPILKFLDRLKLHIGSLHLSLLTLIQGLLYLAILLWAANLLSRFIEDRLAKSTSLTPSVAVLTSKVGRILLFVTAFLLAISSVGIDLTVFTVFGGALGVGLGFGLQKVVSNFISGIILLLDKSIKPGDVISIGNTYGWVKSLNARYVSLDTRDGIEHLIPNEELIIQRVENWSYSNSRIRLRIPVGIHYDSDVRLAIEQCIEAATANPRILKVPSPQCLLRGFGDSSVDLEIRAWITDPQSGIANVQSDILLEVWDRFHEHGIEIPYPQRDVHIKTPLTLNYNSEGEG